MKPFSTLLSELYKGAAKSKGTYEIHATKPEAAVEYAKSILGDEYNNLTDFIGHYRFAQRQAGGGWTVRKDMPRITSRDVHAFQNALQTGSIDIRAPFAKGTSKNPFPEGLKLDAANQWLKNGLEMYDGSATDDKVRVTHKRIEAGKLKPIQRQIYLSESIDMIRRNTVEGTKRFIGNETIFIVSADNFIIDGHHRYLSAVLIDPSMKVNVISIDLPIKTLLPLALAYGDAVGNERNK